MKDVIVTYSSNYGHTKKYADYIASKLNCKIVNLHETKIDFYKDYDIIIYCAPIKNNMIVDAYKFTFNFDLLNPNAKLYIFADGILEPTEKVLKGIAEDNFFKADVGKVKFYYGEGGLNIETLKWSDMLHLRYYIEEGLKGKPGDRYYEMAKIIGEPFDHSDMAYADPLISAVMDELDE